MVAEEGSLCPHLTLCSEVVCVHQGRQYKLGS